MKDTRTILTEELLALFLREQYSILGAASVEGYAPPRSLPNDGYGDQQPKRPDILAYDAAGGGYVIGLVKSTGDNLESIDALTQYDVFLDHLDAKSGRPSKVFVILPASRIAEFTSLITHYLHPERWEQLTIVRSKSVD